MLQTFCRTICPNTVLLFEDRMKHPALRVIVIHYLSLLTRVLSRKLTKHPKNWVFKFFPLITFFFGWNDFFTGRGVSGSGKPSGSGKFFYFYSFFCLFELENLIQPWKFQFLKNYQIWSFFLIKMWDLFSEFQPR